MDSDVHGAAMEEAVVDWHAGAGLHADHGNECHQLLSDDDVPQSRNQRRHDHAYGMHLQHGGTDNEPILHHLPHRQSRSSKTIVVRYRGNHAVSPTRRHLQFPERGWKSQGLIRSGSFMDLLGVRVLLALLRPDLMDIHVRSDADADPKHGGSVRDGHRQLGDFDHVGASVAEGTRAVGMEILFRVCGN